MILQALKNMYPKAREKVIRAVMKDLEKCRGKNMSTEELADWIGKLVTAHTIQEALRINTEDDSKPSQVGDESSSDCQAKCNTFFKYSFGERNPRHLRGRLLISETTAFSCS